MGTKCPRIMKDAWSYFLNKMVNNKNENLVIIVHSLMGFVILIYIATPANHYSVEEAYVIQYEMLLPVYPT